jgi:low affinity Fe/Cu permease
MPPHNLAARFTRWIGSSSSIVVHTIIFILCFVAVLFGFDLDKVLLVLTTAVSLEAIYLAIFIQMSVNNQGQSIQEVEKDIDEIQEDIDEIQEDVDEIQEDVEEVVHAPASEISLEEIYSDLQKLVMDVEKFKQQNNGHDKIR